MAKKPKVNKSQAVRDYLAGHPDAMPKEVMAALAKEGVEVSRILVAASGASSRGPTAAR